MTILYFSMNLYLVTFTKNSLHVPEQSKFKKHEKTIFHIRLSMFAIQIRSKMRYVDLKKTSFTFAFMYQGSFFTYNWIIHFFINFPFLTLATLKRDPYNTYTIILPKFAKKAWFDTFDLDQKNYHLCIFMVKLSKAFSSGW